MSVFHGHLRFHANMSSLDLSLYTRHSCRNLRQNSNFFCISKIECAHTPDIARWEALNVWKLLPDIPGKSFNDGRSPPFRPRTSSSYRSFKSFFPKTTALIRDWSIFTPSMRFEETALSIKACSRRILSFCFNSPLFGKGVRFCSVRVAPTWSHNLWFQVGNLIKEYKIENVYPHIRPATRNERRTARQTSSDSCNKWGQPLA